EHGFACGKIKNVYIGRNNDRVAKLLYGRRGFFTDSRGRKVQSVYRFPVQSKSIFEQTAEIRKFTIAQITVDGEFANSFHHVNILFGERDVDIETGVKIIPSQIS